MGRKVEITPATRIGDLLDSYPELEEVLIAEAPAFGKLRNPVLRRTVARIATVEKAASIAGLPVREFVATLRRAVGQEVDDPDAHERPGGPAPAEGPAALPGWVEAARVTERIDADALLDAGEMPLARIVKRARELGHCEILCVVSTFRPTPLTAKLEEIGFPCHVHAVGSGRYETYIAVPSGGS
jgi:hypothetical protein